MGARWMSLERRTARRSPRARTDHHLALFASALPPASSVGVLRPLSFMRYACSAGWRIDAFCSEPPPTQRQHGEELLARVPGEATIHVVTAPARQPSYRFFPRVDGGFPNAVAFARDAIETMANDPPTVVMATAPRFFTFVAALFVARRFGVPLVLDYRDEWTECPFDFVQTDGDDRHWERRCLRHADAVLFTTESHKVHQLATFPELAPEKVFVVPNGWDPTEFAATPATASAAANSMLRIAYVGNLAGHTPPHEFLASLEQLLDADPEWIARIRVTFIGRRGAQADEAIRAFRFPDVIEVIDQVGKHDAIRWMRESDALLLLAHEGLERYLPAKLFEYLAARRPVLIFGTRGEASGLSEQLGAGVFCPPGSPTALRDALLQLKNLNIAPHDAAVDRWLQDHRRDVLAARALEIIKQLAAPAV